LGQGIERVQLTDFGLARAADDASRTRSGIIAGTPQYMSPEQARGDEIDQRSDLFSLGCVIYFMLSGRSPFRADSTMGVLHRIVNDEPRSLRPINSDVPPWLEDIAVKLLRKSPTDRFSSANELAELLHDWLAHLQNPSESPPPTSYQQASSRRSKLIVAGVLFSALALLLTAWFTYALLRSIDSNSTTLEQHPSASTINESLDEVHLDVDQLLNELQ
jgi:serine/threonine-protein kinase